MTSLMNIGLLLDCCGIYYTDEQVEKLEKLVENFIEKIIREKTGAADTKSENLNVKEEEPENLTENDENFSQNFMSSDICDIELKEEDDQDQEYQDQEDNIINDENYYESEEDIPVKKKFKKERKEKCQICFKSFASQDSMEEHFKKYHENGEFKCHICQATFTFTNYLRSHMKSAHEGLDSFQCMICQASFSSDYKLQKHIAVEKHVQPVHEREKLEKCKICSKTFATKGCLKTHIRNFHKGEEGQLHENLSLEKEKQSTGEDKKPLEELICHICSKFFDRPNRLQVHIATVHEGKQPYQCEICAKQFSTAGGLKHHVTRCDEKFPGESLHHQNQHKCPVCSKLYATKSSLNAHIKALHEELKCDTCCESFSSMILYRKHIAKLHKGIKYTKCPDCNNEVREDYLLRHQKKCKVDWQCPICQKSFKNRKDRLEEHIETVHEGKKSYQCQKCATFFTTKPGLIHHEKSVHEGIRHHCQICNADFASSSHLNVHLKQNHIPNVEKEHECEICSDRIIGFEAYKKHIEDAHPGTKIRKKGSETCPHCAKDLSNKQRLRMHIRTVHMRETRFKCDQCNFACMYKQGLESHIRSIHLKERENLCTMCPKRYFDKRDLIKHMENNHSITSNNKSKHHSPSKRSKREVIVD